MTLLKETLSQIELLLSSWTDSCGMLHPVPSHDSMGERAPEGWGVNPEEEREGRLGREFYHLDPNIGVTVFVPML